MTSAETLLFRVNGMAAAHKIRRKEVENTGHLLLGYTLYKAKPVEKERERGE
jgi:hypothetical protein